MMQQANMILTTEQDPEELYADQQKNFTG